MEIVPSLTSAELKEIDPDLYAEIQEVWEEDIRGFVYGIPGRDIERGVLDGLTSDQIDTLYNRYPVDAMRG